MGYKAPEELKNASVKVAITQEMREEIEEYCMATDMSLSAFLRRAISDLLIRGPYDWDEEIIEE